MGRYRDRLVPVGDRWLIAHRFVSTDWRAPDSIFGGAAAAAEAAVTSATTDSGVPNMWNHVQSRPLAAAGTFVGAGLVCVRGRPPLSALVPLGAVAGGRAPAPARRRRHAPVDGDTVPVAAHLGATTLHRLPGPSAWARRR